MSYLDFNLETEVFQLDRDYALVAFMQYMISDKDSLVNNS